MAKDDKHHPRKTKNKYFKSRVVFYMKIKSAKPHIHSTAEKQKKEIKKVKRDD
jgi:FtsZ-interacting cell division protein ZipA